MVEVIARVSTIQVGAETKGGDSPPQEGMDYGTQNESYTQDGR